MSANSCDVSKIRDEDVLRQMWQETEDFGRKKEIRAHMYKVREARLKDLYSSGTETQTQVSVQKTSSKSSNIKTTHADSLADHSFLSLKSKEVRDSESPTRDVAFNNKINVADQYGNTGWTITSSDDTSNDGKTHTAVRTATTSGTEKIDKGISSYAAKAEQKATVYQDGDANNFKRAVGTSDASTIHQEASGGDESSSFKTSSTNTKSSSKTVTESQSKSGDIVDYSIPKETVRETRDQIIPANAKTVVYTETKTLPDGSKVTTTRYETRGGSSKAATTSSSSATVQKSSSTNQQSSSEQRSSSQHVTDKQQKSIDYGVDTIDYKKAIKLSEDLSKNVNISSVASNKLIQQEIIRDSKKEHFDAHDTKVQTSKLQTQQDKQICEVKPPQQFEPLRKESSPPILSAPSPVGEDAKSPRKEPEPAKPYEQPERRQPVKPSKSELEVTSKATEGQYDTTYRSEFINKKIHVEVSPTHDAFVRSLRALTPEDLKASSNTFLRSSQSPEKMRHPVTRVSPDRLYSAKRYTSPEKSYELPKYSPERVTDTITKRKKVTDDSQSTTVRSSTLTRDTTSKDRVESRSRSVSPTTTSSDFEFVSKRKSAQVSDLDMEDTTITRRTTKAITEIGDSRPSTLNYSKKSKKITERSPTSPLTDLLPSKRTPSPTKETSTNIRRTSLKEEQHQRQEKIIRRTDTYEERCRQILGIPEKKKPERNISDIINTDRKTHRTSSRDKITQEVIVRKPSLPDAARHPSKSPEKCTVNGYSGKKSPAKERPSLSEFPSQIRRSPERKSLDRVPERQSPIKDKSSTISEFPSQIRKSPQKVPLEKYPERKSPQKESPKIEFPAQIRRSPVSCPERQSPAREAPIISEFPSQIRKSPERQSEKTYPVEETPKISEFPSQISPAEKEPLQKPAERQSPSREAPKMSEVPSQIRRTPEREPETKVSVKDAPQICEFPSQIRKTPEREPLPKYPERESPNREVLTINEFPSQIRRTPEKESPKIAEFPTQIRKTPEYPEKKIPCKQAPTICEFPSQIRKTPEREALAQYPEKQKETKEPSKQSEFPSQIRKTPEREPLPKYPERKSPNREAPTINEFPSQIRRTPEKESPKIAEFPTQIRKTPEYPEKKIPCKQAPTICEFPSQIRKTPEREALAQYPEKQKETKEPSKQSEFPSQIRKTPEREPLPKYPERKSPNREAPTINEFPSQIRRTPEKESPKIAEFPSQIHKTPEREPLPEYPEKMIPCKQAPTICEFPSQIRKTPEREPLSQYPEKQTEAKEPSKLSEFPSQIRRSPARDSTDNMVTTEEAVTTKKLSEFPSQTKKTPKPTTEDKVLQETTDYLYKDKIPIDEPMFTKKFIAELGSDDECEITVDEYGNTKINTIDDEELYIQETQNVSQKTVKKDSPERQFIREKLSQGRDQTIKQQIDEFISTERNDIYRTTESRKSSPDLRRSPERGILKHRSQFDEKTEKLRIGTKTTDDQIKVEIKVESKPKTITNYSTTKKLVVRDSSDSKINIKSAKTTKELPDNKPKPTLSKTPSNKTVRKMDTTKFAKTYCDIKLETITKSSSADSKVSKKFVQKLPEPTTTPKRHVVTTTINVTPKISKESTTRVIKNITNTQTVQPKPNTTTIPLKSSSTKKIDVENIENQKRITQKKRIDKLVRTINEPTVKSPSSRTPTRLTELTTKSADVKDKKCITTKTILINNTVADEREIIVDLLRSTSTREDQNTVCPIPVKNNDGKGSPRYPDQVLEPDDFSVKHTPRKLPSLPIDEYEDISDFTGVTEVTIQDVIKEEETTEEIVDESLLSVNEKVSKFSNQRNQQTNVGRTLKLERPILIIDEKLESDECLLSVSEKVNKFVNKAEKLSIADMPERPKSPRCQNIIDITDIDENDESLMSVSDKVTHFVTTAENVKKPQSSTIKVEKTDLSTVDESLKTDECLLSVSDKVTKFITTAETLTTQKDAKKPTTKKPLKTSDDLTEECITIETEEQTYTRQRQTTPKNIDRTSPTRRTSIKEERRTSRKDSSSTVTKKDSSSVTEIETTPKTSRPSTKPLLVGTTPLRSTESIRKAKALFENMATGTENRELKRQKDILNRPSVFDARKKPPETITRRLTPDRDDVKLKDIGIGESTTGLSKVHISTDIRRKLSFPSDDECKTTTDYKSSKTLLEKARALEVDDLNETKYDSPDNLEVPGYMKPLDRSLRPNSPHRSSVTDIEESVSKTTTIPETVLTEEPTPASKFGVTLRRTDSGKNFISTISSTTATTERRKSLSSILKNYEIEEIYELDILEELLETTVGYDLRRRIRAQIRLVKNLISEDKLKIINLKPSKFSSPSRETPETKVFTKKPSGTTKQVPETKIYNRKPSDTNFTEYQTKYIRKSSADTKAINNHLYDHTNLVDGKDANNKTEYQSSYTRKSSTTKNDTFDTDRNKSSAKSRETSPETKPCRRAKSPEKPERQTTSKYFQTELKKVSSSTKSTKDDKPDWVMNRTLRKISDTPSPVAKKYTSSTTKTTVTTKEIKSSGIKDSKPTDIITSSYGVGPIDENGSPLFGLKALRTQNKLDQSKVQGTVVRSQFYSENGQEPVGEISVTKYSTDPADLSSDEEITREAGLLSKTTTQKFGHKGTPSYKSVIDRKQLSEIENDNRTKKSTTKVTRRGSVKEITQKFLENTVDSLKSEKQAYPKAGLILRTSSFKDKNGNSGTDESPTEEHAELSTVTTVRTSSSKTTSREKGQTFLTNKNKVTGMQDIVSRMQESNKETREGDSFDDIEARSLLNKFLGSQVILSGIEGSSTKASNKSSSTRKATTKISTTITEGGKPRTVTRTFTHPITAEDIADICDEETLRLLLEQSTDYDERRVLRARLKEVMAEKEVCATSVEDAKNQQPATNNSSASTSHSSSTTNMSSSNNNSTVGSSFQQQQGESLLLPLLQGLLDAPDLPEPANNPDSGTECGEDLRSGLIIEVQSALDKLTACLCSDSTDITNERRESLLQLVSKLQANLVTSNNPLGQAGKNSERRASGQSRFNKRKQRQNRHTIGVTSEELEDARRLMEEFALKDIIPLQKQNSESAVQRNGQAAAFRPVKFQPHKPLHIKNATAKPFNSSNNSSISHTPSGASSTIDTPTETLESLDLLFSEPKVKSPPHQIVEDTNKYIYKQSISLDHNDESHYKKPLQQTMSLDYNNVKDVDLMSIHQAVQQAAATKQQLKSIDSETDEDPSTLKATPQLSTVDLFHHTILKSQEEYNQQPDLLLQSNPLFINRDDSGSSIDKENRFNNKKLKMKRANTIDIPKPMKCYIDENESEEDEGLDRRHSNYIQLRGPLNVGKFNNNKIIPTFEAKTESDKKFMAFINRQHSEKVANSMAKTSIWDNHQREQSGHGSGANWNRKFGNIKTTFDRSSSTESNTSKNSVRNFWKTADDAHTAGVLTYNGPKISKQSARNLQQMFEEKQKQCQSVPWAGESTNIVKGSLKVDAKSKNKFIPQSTSVNMFSHAPMSAFKPIQKNQINVVPSTKVPSNIMIHNTKPHQKQSSSISHQQIIVDPSTPETTLFLYSPKPFNHESNSYSSVTAVSPTIKQTPWNQTSNESRVRNIAVAKFEATPESPLIATAPIVSTRKKSTEKVSMPKYLQQSAERDRAPANYVSYSSTANHQNKQGGSVQKISGKYNVLTENNEPPPIVRHQSAFATVPQSNPKFTENYQQLPYTHSITYSQPKVPYNTQFYNQVDETSYNKTKLDQARMYHQMPQETYQTKYHQQRMSPPKHDSHIVYNNVHHRTQPQSTNYVNRQSVIEQEQPYSSRSTPKSPYQNGHHLEYTTHTSQHLPAAETAFVSNVSPPQMHYNELYRTIEDPIRNIATQFSPPQSPPSRVPKYESQMSEESVHEYNAVSSRVMTGPVSQQAVNVNQNGPKNRNQHDIDAAFSLKNTLQKIDKVRLDKSPTPPTKQMPNVMVNDKPLESLEINDRGESIVTSKFHIPIKAKPELRPSQGQALSKSDSWRQICQSGTTNKPSPRSSPNARTVTSVSKSKSTHTLALPKQFEAGMSRDEMAQKKQTMQAYFAGSKSPKLTVSNKNSTINRTKTSQKVSVMRQMSGGLSRSRTLPDIVSADLLDESNVDEAFEDLFKAKSFDSSKQSFTEDPITTTPPVSPTKVLSQQQVSKKPMSPFAKFKQLDRANSLNTPPSTPKTPGGGGGGPMFKFTDPQLSRSASTIKERLLQWCQMKTKEYENIQLDNFSGSWADGLAFCALIHHFIPDAFDYTKLTPNNRRYNFTLAFQTADEKADIAPLLDVDDMVATRRPDWKCVFTYVQSIYRRFKDED